MKSVSKVMCLACASRADHSDKCYGGERPYLEYLNNWRLGGTGGYYPELYYDTFYPPTNWIPI
jgi:hypothetical protein